jgi:hypothetical protein
VKTRSGDWGHSGTSLTALLLAADEAVLLAAAILLPPGPRAPLGPDRWHRTVTSVTSGVSILGKLVIALQPPFISGAIGDGYFPMLLGGTTAAANRGR